MSQDLPHHDQMTPDSAPSFSDHLVCIIGIWCLHLLSIKIEVYGFFFTAS